MNKLLLEKDQEKVNYGKDEGEEKEGKVDEGKEGVGRRENSNLFESGPWRFSP